MEIKNQLKQIADRIKYLRDILDMSALDLANAIDMPLDLYNSYENCEKDIPISMIYNVASALGVDPTELLTGESPRMEAYAVTRKGAGVGIERNPGIVVGPRVGINRPVVARLFRAVISL